MASLSDELVLLERVFLRIGSADTDEQLEESLNKFLPPVLLKLSSQQEEVRKKVMELLTHINKRVKTRPQVQLPVESLLMQYQDPAASVFLTNFTIIYIKMGFPRLAAQKQAELIPSILNSIENKPAAHQESLLLLIIKALQHVKWPSDPAKRQAMFNLTEKPNLKKLLSQLLLDVLLQPYGPHVTSLPAPAGMSQYTYNKIATEVGTDSDTLEQIKLGIIKFLSSDALSDNETLCPLIVGAAEARFAVANSADLQLRKIIGGIDWESPPVLAPLYLIYLGSKDGPAEKQREPASIRLRLKMLPYLCKARKQGILWPASIRVLFDSLYGQNTHVKLKAQALTFCSVIIQQVSAAQLSVMASVILTSGLMKLIAESDGEPSIKQQAYLTAGQLVSKVPSLVKQDLSLLQTLFSVLCQEENNEVRMSVREALLTMATAFSVDETDQQLLLALLTTQVESPSPAARLVAVRYLATVFPQTHALSRLYLLIATGDSQEEIASEAMKSIYGAGYKLSSEGKGDSAAVVEFPEFVEMMSVVLEKAKTREENINTRLIIKNQRLAFNLTAYTQVVTYLSLCLSEKCGVKTNGQRLQHPCESTRAVGEYLRQLHSTQKQLLDTYVTFQVKLVKADTAVAPISCLLEFVGCIPDLLAANFQKELPWFKKLLSDSREDVRDVAAQLYGCLAGFSGLAVVTQELNQMVAQLDMGSKDLESLHGNLLATGYCIERAVVSLGDNVNSSLYETPVRTVITFLEHNHTMVVGAASTALGEVGRVVALPLPDSKTDSLKAPGLLDVVNKLLDNITSAKLTSKVKERSCRAAGMLCLTETFAYRQQIIDFFISNAKEIKDVEIQMSVGETLVCCVLGPSSPLKQDLWTGVKSDCMSCYDPEPACTSLLKTLLKDILPKPHPHSRQSCCIWLLAVLKHCGKLKAMKQHLMDLQSGFMDLLSENNDIVQDVASKGLALVYESGDEESRAALVSLLVDQLTVGRRSVAQVTQDTKLFEEGTLGQAPTGGNLSTYKELCSLASDLNQPDLIYKFMHLANHNAIWNSKKGAAFGFSTIAKAAGEQLSDHLPKILPRLYRYQFDPTPKIQQSMASIWQALVSETNKTVELYHKEIFEDLINNLTTNQWRVRMSCCLALSDFLRSGGSKVFQDCMEMLPRLWKQLFRVMDDVHEGTRQAAAGTTRILSKLCVQWCDPDKGKAGEAMVKTILPTVLEVGICHQVSEIRSISVQTVSQLVKSGGPLLRPHLPLLVPALLEAAGELESLSLNHLSVRLAADQRSQDIVDSIRASAAKSHYTTETVSKCVQYIDTETFAALLPRLLELLRSSIGLGTRVATAHFIVLICHHLTIEQFQPYVGKLLAALFSGLTDRNSTIRRTCANSIGQVVRSAKPSSVDNLLEKLKTNYLEKEDESMRTAVGLTLQAMARHNQDVIKARADLVIPLVFFAMHTAKNKDDPSSVSNWELWQDVWHEVSPGMEAALTRHLDEVMALLSTVMQSASWHVKAQAARSIESLAGKVGGSLAVDKRDVLVSLLVSGLAGRTWDGKEQLLTALASLSKHSKSLKDSPSANTIVDALLRECGKEKVSYKSSALAALGEALEALEVDRFQQVYAIVQEILTKEVDNEENEKHEETSKRREELLTLREIAFTTLGKAWPRCEKTQAELREQVVAQCVSCLENNTRSVQVKIMTAVHNYCDKLVLWQRVSLAGEERAALHSIISKIAPALRYALGISKHTQLRKEALNVLFLLSKNCKSLNETAELKTLEAVFNEHLEELNKDNSPEVKSRVVDIKDFFNNLNKD